MFDGALGRSRLVFVAMLAAGGGLAGLAAREAHAIRRAEAFVPAPCTIEELTFDRSREVRDNRVVYHYTPQVKFRFQIDAETYHGDRAAVRPVELEGEFAAEEFRTQYGPGSATICYYDPADPNEAVLSRESSWANVAAFRQTAGAAVSLGVIGLLLPLAFGRWTNPRRRPGPPPPTPRVRFGLPDDVPTQDALERTRRIIRERANGER